MRHIYLYFQALSRIADTPFFNTKCFLLLGNQSGLALTMPMHWNYCYKRTAALYRDIFHTREFDVYGYAMHTCQNPTLQSYYLYL
jgi:hypothetical protein